MRRTILALSFAFTLAATLNASQHARAYSKPPCTNCRPGNCPPPLCDPSSGQCTLCNHLSGKMLLDAVR